MSLFNSESEMQEWLEDEIKNLHDFAELIENKDYLENPDKIARTILEKKYLKSFSETLSSLYSNVLLSNNKNISLNKRNILKPDFILYSADNEGIVIIELKNAINATRQLGTEILAYAKEIKSYFPLISDNDIYSVIISNEWPTLLKHFIFYEIYWQNKNIICLQPNKKNRKLKLSILNVKELIQDNFMIRIPKQFLTGFQHCLYDLKSSIINHRKKIENHLEQMKSSLGIMQSEGNKLKSHGFAFLWKDNSQLSLAPYNITIINMSAFASLERFLHPENKFEELNEMLQILINSIGDLSSIGHSRSLSRIVVTTP